MLSARKTLSVGTPMRKVYRSCKEPVGRRIFYNSNPSAFGHSLLKRENYFDFAISDNAMTNP